ncbi:hypothetical protein FRC20_008915 [Serendipita sp. 405]|nr:hypothetical protein FRC20_008915 [Serendipita sp. 405]
MTHMLLCRMFFERFNVAGFTYIERPLASLYGANQISGVVIEIGQDETDVIACFESQLHHGSSLSIPIGTRDCERYLAQILRSNSSATAALSPPELPVDGVELDRRLIGLARHLWQSGHVKIPIEGDKEKEEEGNLDIAALLVSGKERTIIEAANSRKKPGQTKAEREREEREKEMAAKDLISVNYLDYPAIIVGKERHRFCEPLFEPLALNHAIPLQTVVEMDGLSYPPPVVPRDLDLILPLQTAVHVVVKATPFPQRPHIYFGLLITGDLGNIQGLGLALQSRLAPFLCIDRQQTETPIPQFQATLARTAKVPEYFAEFRDKGDLLAAFLGCGIIAKMTFGDASGRNFVTKAEYGEKGPPAILGLAPTLL